jgi:UDP-N-acetyl-D-mannosaminuronic acid dehydrogenase
MSFTRIAVIGLGYIGLPTAASLARQSLSVIGMDINPVTTELINRGQAPMNEPELAEVILEVVNQGRLRASTQVEPADAFIIAVPTPLGAANQPDISAIRAAIDQIAPVLKPGDLILLESTSPVGTTEKLARWIGKLRPDLAVPSLSDNPNLAIAYCPERVLPGQIMRELLTNDRVIGGLTAACAAKARTLYQLFVQGECMLTDARTAEMCKMVENSYRDVNIAFANELALICHTSNIDVRQLIRLANHHPRVNILQPGPGVGGHCIAVDPWFIVAEAPEQARLIRLAREVNDQVPDWFFDRIQQKVAQAVLQRNCRPSEITIACFGLAFKADVGDLRESPAVKIVSKVCAWHQGQVLIVEPNIASLPDGFGDNSRLVDSDTALQKADLLVMLTDHQPFKAITRESLIHYQIVDSRGIWQ